MKELKIILFIVFGASLYGQFSMLVKGEEFPMAWLPILITIIIIIFLIRSLAREKQYKNEQ